MTLHIPFEIFDLAARGALFVINHSGGKDSQAMYLELANVIPDDQILVVHADLPGADWPGTGTHIKRTTWHDVTTVRAGKTFMEMVRHRGMWPSPKYRQCTSDLKRGPIEKAIRHYLKDHPEHGGLVVNCMGLRAEESASRAKADVFKFNKRNSKAGREWYDWLPIHDYLIDQVWGVIRAASQAPHWAYFAGMTRLSCIFCIMSSLADILTAAWLMPAAYREYASVERELDHTFAMPVAGERRFLDEITGVAA